PPPIRAVGESHSASRDMSGEYRVELPVFEGPLDLLLYLIRKHELDIFDIPIAFITERYLDYLETMRGLNLDVAGEYLFMAATLAYIKSRQLLATPVGDGLEDGNIEEDDPRQELIRRLLEYQKYKQGAETLGERPLLGRTVWGAGAPALPGEPMSASLGEIGLFKLIEALGGVLARSGTRLTHDVVVDRISITDKIHELVARLEKEGSFSFESCFAEGAADDSAPARHAVVVTFLALLEMTRLRMIRLHQPEGCR